MKDEIKEILKVLEKHDILSVSQDSILKDYITNLQEKLKVSQTNEETFRLEMEDITKCLGLKEDTIFDEVKEYATNLQERKITKEDVDKYFEENMCVSFDKFIENWNAQKEWADYFQERNKKAIKYIDDEIKKIRSHQYATGIRRINKIKNILQGEDKDVKDN